MASVIVEHEGVRKAGTIGGRLLIGRTAANSIVIPDPAVSRLHAFINRTNGHFVIADGGSRTGTLLNGQRIKNPQPLTSGDEIQIGPARIIFRDEPADAPSTESSSEDSSSAQAIAPAEFPARDTVNDFSAGGILFDCSCGAPLWVNAKFAGLAGNCRYCGAPVKIPTLPAELSQRIADDTPAINKCGICHWPIEVTEERTDCPSCHLNFHTDCWQENRGCSAYGCSGVNALDPKAKAAVTPGAVEPADAYIPDATERPFPWAYLLLGAAVLGAALGAVIFGVPSLLVAILSLMYLPKKQQPHRGLTLLCLALGVLGFAAGIAISYTWWFTGRNWHWML